MKKIILYLLTCLIVTVILMLSHNIWSMPPWYINNLLLIQCSLIGTMGGILYGLRAVYINQCIKKNWDTNWEVWYYLRPIVSTITGFVSFLFLKAGLLVLDAAPRNDTVIFGYLAIAFVAGYNVDNFLKKIESVSCEIWGIKKSRVSDEIEFDEKKKDIKS